MGIDLEQVDVLDFLSALSIRNILDEGEEAHFSCPFVGHRHGDNTPSAYMNKRTTAFYCWGCKEKGNAIHFLAKYENIGLLKAAHYIQERYCQGFQEPDSPDSLMLELEKMWTDKEKNQTYNNSPVDYNVRKLSGTPLNYLLGRGFCQSAIDFWGLGYDPISDRIAIPVHNHNDRLIGFKARAYKETQTPRYLCLGDKNYENYGFKPFNTSQVLFGLNRVLGYWKETKQINGPIIVCEGELNTIALWQHGFRNAVAMCGTNFTEIHTQLLLSYAERIIIFTDNDVPGTKAASDIAEALLPYMEVDIVQDHEGDPASICAERCAKLINEPINLMAELIPEIPEITEN